MRGVLLCLFLCILSGHALKILSIFPFAAHSHYTIGRSLMRDLAKRGHNVTFIAPFEEKEPIENLRTIVLTGFAEKMDEILATLNPFDLKIPGFLGIFLMGVRGSDTVERVFSHDNVQALLNSNEKFDVFMTEQCGFDGLQAIAYHFGIPSILVSAVGQTVWTNHVVGNPEMLSYANNPFLEFPIHKNFFKRTLNVLVYISQKIFEYLYVYPTQNGIIQKYLPNSPHIYDLIYNTSLILLNSHVSYKPPTPQVPNMIEIGGFHVQPLKKLPDDLQVILDKAKDGVIYFSMGSVLKSKALPMGTRDAILRTFSKLKETVLWKFESDEMPGKPANVVIRKWFPQQDILAHPNVKLFITHGGILSAIESIHHGIPILGMPVFGDQRTNMGIMVHNGYGVKLNYRDLSEENFSEAIEEVLSNPKYTEAVKYASTVMHDQQMKPADRAEFWIEYVVRHKGAKHLRSAALDLAWYQLISLDVILFLIIVTAVLLRVSYIAIRWLFCKKTVTKQKTN